MRKSVALVFNPAAGSRWSRRPSLETVVEALRGAGGDVQVFPTRGPRDGFTQGRAAAERAEVVAVFGGDGTVNETLNGVVEARTGPTLQLLPGGTVNVLARDLRIPLNPVRAAQLLDSGTARSVYLGCATSPNLPGGRRYFALMAGLGLDASVVYGVGLRRRAKKVLGPWAFVAEGLRHAFRYPFPAIRVAGDESAEVSGYFAVVANSPGYAGWFSLARSADPCVSGFQVAVCTERRAWLYFYYLGLALGGRVERSPAFVFFPAERVRAAGGEKVRVQVDGEYLGILPMEFRSDGTTVRILAP